MSDSQTEYSLPLSDVKLNRRSALLSLFGLAATGINAACNVQTLDSATPPEKVMADLASKMHEENLHTTFEPVPGITQETYEQAEASVGIIAVTLQNTGHRFGQSGGIKDVTKTYMEFVSSYHIRVEEGHPPQEFSSFSYQIPGQGYQDIPLTNVHYAEDPSTDTILFRIYFDEDFPNRGFQPMRWLNMAPITVDQRVLQIGYPEAIRDSKFHNDKRTLAQIATIIPKIHNDYGPEAFFLDTKFPPTKGGSGSVIFNVVDGIPFAIAKADEAFKKEQTITVDGQFKNSYPLVCHLFNFKPLVTQLDAIMASR